MQSSVESAKQDPLHWMCRLVDGKQKLNLGEVYKAGVTLVDECGEGAAGSPPPPALRSCADDRRKGLAFERKGPYPFQLYAPLQQEARCLAVDLFFVEPAAVAEIRFRNHYVAQLSVLMKFAGGCREWEATVARLQLMPHPHCEGGARAQFAVAPRSPPYGACWPEVSEIRLVLRQPSANWRRFYVENVAVYGERGPETRRSVYLAHLAQKTTEALRMERKNERRASSAIPFHIGTHGYEIDKLHKF